MLLKDTKRKTWTTYIIYVHRGIAKHLSFTLACSLNFGEISMNKNLKLDASSICLYFLRYVIIRTSIFRSSTPYYIL